MSAGLDLVVLSPHLDDAVLSCGGRIAATTAAGGRALVAARRAEDDEACRRLGAEPLHWDLADALYRTAADGAPLYPTRHSLYSEPAPGDDATAARLAERIAGLPAHRLLLAPLAIGGHVDHRLARRAAASSGREVAYYEDFPYVEWKWFALERALGGRRGWEAETLPLDARLLARRQEAIAAYASQVPALFRSEARLAKQLRRAARRAGGERIWRPRSRPAEPAR